MLGPVARVEDIEPFIVEVIIVPTSEMNEREAALGSALAQSCLALRRAEWQPPDEKAWHHFAGPEGLRLL